MLLSIYFEQDFKFGVVIGPRTASIWSRFSLQIFGPIENLLLEFWIFSHSAIHNWWDLWWEAGQGLLSWRFGWLLNRFGFFGRLSNCNFRIWLITDDSSCFCRPLNLFLIIIILVYFRDQKGILFI